eukprot:gene17768-biopygen18353
MSAQMPRYYIQWWESYYEGVEAPYSWWGQVNWINPPWGLLDEVARMLRGEGVGGTVVAPYWPGKSLFQDLEAVVDEVVILLRQRDLFALGRLGGLERLGPSSGDAVMFHVPGFFISVHGSVQQSESGLGNDYLG